jgi:glutathione peroxidase
MLKKTLIMALFLISMVALISAGSYKNKSVAKPDDKITSPNVSDIKVKTMDGVIKSLSDYNGKVLLIVNVASYCGNTPQYEGLENIYEKYKNKGFEILAFPCNDFGQQEPGTVEEIKNFCATNYHVTFTLFDKVLVLGDSKCPLYAKLTQAEPAGEISWNFEKFIIDKKGNVVGRFKPKMQPEDTQITSMIENYLDQK